MPCICTKCGQQIIPRAEPGTRRSRYFPLVNEDAYTPDELEFMRAVERFKTEHNKPFPLFTDILAVLISLGYRKA